jgi:hypothetical protein
MKRGPERDRLFQRFSFILLVFEHIFFLKLPLFNSLSVSLLLILLILTNYYFYYRPISIFDHFFRLSFYYPILLPYLRPFFLLLTVAQ